MDQLCSLAPVRFIGIINQRATLIVDSGLAVPVYVLDIYSTCGYTD